jgi:hypothetical protein
MEREIIIQPENPEISITVRPEPFTLTQTQSKSVTLDMANGDQRILPDAGYMLQSVIVEKPEELVPGNIVKGVVIGGVVGEYEGAVLPELDNPATAGDVFDGKEYIDSDGVKQTGTFRLPELTNPAPTYGVFDGYDYIGPDGVKYEGDFSYPSLDSPAGTDDVFLGKEYLDGNGQKRIGTYAFPMLENPATSSDVFAGKEYLNQNGEMVTGSYHFPALQREASPSDVFAGFEYLDAEGHKQTGSFAYPVLSNPATAADVVNGKEYIDGSGAKQTGVLNPDVWANEFLNIYHTSVTVGENSVNTTLGVKDYILQEAGVDNNRLFAFAIREKPSYVNGEIGRCILYPNSNIGYFSATQYQNGAWGTGRMLSGYSATLPAGSVYDVYHWSV